MTPEPDFSIRDAERYAAKCLSEHLHGKRGGQLELLATRFATACVSRTVASQEDEWELDSKLSRSLDILYNLQSFGFPIALAEVRWSDEAKLSEVQRSSLRVANNSIWKRRDPSRSFADGFNSPAYFSGASGELHEILSRYLAQPWLRDGSVDWIFLDMMVTRELSAFGEEIKIRYLPGRKDTFGMHAKYWRAEGNFERMMPSLIETVFGLRRSLNDPRSQYSTSLSIWKTMLEVWRGLAGPVINPRMVKEAMIDSKRKGAVWDVPSWALIDQVEQLDGPIWNVGPYSH